MGSHIQIQMLISLTLNPFLSAPQRATRKMCTPWTRSLVRWRVRDSVPCFVSDEEPATFYSMPPQLPIQNVVFNATENLTNKDARKRLPRSHKGIRDALRSQQRSANVGDENGNRGDATENVRKKLPRSHKGRRKALLHSQHKWADVEDMNGNSGDEPSWDENFIVFCFKENGAFEVVNNGNHHACRTRNSRPVNRKLDYDEDSDVWNNRESVRLKEDSKHYTGSSSGGDCVLTDDEGEGETNNYVDTNEGLQIEEHNNEGMESTESSNSNQSDASTGSFAFPVMGWEWIGSPVQMPKSEGLQRTKQKARFVRFHCCRFY